MSTKTLRKRIALVAVSAMGFGLLTAVTAPVAQADHAAVGGTNDTVTTGTLNGSMFTAVGTNTTGAAVTGTTSTLAGVDDGALSLGLLYKDTTSGTAQSATVLAGGVLSLYAQVSTTSAFTATGGSFAGAAVGVVGTVTYANDLKTVLTSSISAATAIATKWTAPSTPGTYNVYLYVSDGIGNAPTLAAPAVTLAAAMAVTVVASSSGGTVSLGDSSVNVDAYSRAATGVDNNSAVANGSSQFINFSLVDAYGAALSSGNIVASATNGALLSIGTAGSTPAAGTASTVVSYAAPTSKSIRIVQGTANAPVTTTVTITFNGTTVATKTVSIKGEVAKLVISDVGVQDLGGTTWAGADNEDGTGRTGGLFYVQTLDSAGNIVLPASAGAFAAVSSTLTQTVQALSVSVAATSTTSTVAQSKSTGIWSCDTTAGQSSVKIKYTNPGTGNVVTSDAFTARCADDPYTYTASWDKTSYVQGELATLTVKFLDSKGNPSNRNTQALGAIISAPMMTAVTTTGAASMRPDANGAKAYTFTVGLSTGITEGTYSAVVDFPSLTAVAATKQTPSYKVGTGSTAVSNAEVLAAIVKLIASINKQITALQKLLTKKK